jgi:hypothetical protein
VRVSRIANHLFACYKSQTAMTDRSAHLTLHTAPQGFGYAYFSYRTWRFS